MVSTEKHDRAAQHSQYWGDNDKAGNNGEAGNDGKAGNNGEAGDDGEASNVGKAADVGKYLADAGGEARGRQGGRVARACRAERRRRGAVLGRAR
jgi:hypothetical protein